MSKVWMITGASSGLGKALAEQAIARGEKVIASFRQPEQAQAFSLAHQENGYGIVLDLTHPESLKQAAKEAFEIYGRIDVLVNNAGYGTIGAVEEFSMDEIRQQMEANFFGCVMLTKEIIPFMRNQMQGHILQISSQAGFKAAAGFGIYNASKFALEGFSEALAQELLPFNIRVVIVEPGPFRTQFAGSSVKLASQKLDVYAKTPVAQMYRYIQNIDGRQEGDPEKAAHALINYVADNRSALRLPLGKSSVLGIRSKLASVEKDIQENEAIALSTNF